VLANLLHKLCIMAFQSPHDAFDSITDNDLDTIPVSAGLAASGGHTWFPSFYVSPQASTLRLYAHPGLPLDISCYLCLQHVVLVANHFHLSRITTYISRNCHSTIAKISLVAGLLGSLGRTWLPITVTFQALTAPSCGSWHLFLFQPSSYRYLMSSCSRS